jgi:hypothetical protein
MHAASAADPVAYPCWSIYFQAYVPHLSTQSLPEVAPTGQAGFTCKKEMHTASWGLAQNRVVVQVPHELVVRV